jgi:hypothetical protein
VDSDVIMRVGTRRRFFDANSAWRETGDIGDNDIYFFPATVVKVYEDSDGRQLVDLVFDHKDGFSKGHFPDNTRPIPMMQADLDEFKRVCQETADNFVEVCERAKRSILLFIEAWGD